MNDTDSLDIRSKIQEHWIITSVAILFVVLTLSASVSTVITLFFGYTSIGSDFASIASAFATIILVGVTGWYTWETRRLVERDITKSQEQQKRKRNQVRRAILSELYGMEYFFSIFSGEKRVFSKDTANRLKDTASTEVYDDVTLEMGLLNKEEVEFISIYYNMVKSLKLNIEIFAATLESDSPESPSEELNISRINIVRLNFIWRKTITTIEPNLPEEVSEDRRRLVELEPLESESENIPTEQSDTQEKILHYLQEQGFATTEEIQRNMDVDLEVEDIEEEIEVLITAGDVIEMNSFYTYSSDGFL